MFIFFYISTSTFLEQKQEENLTGGKFDLIHVEVRDTCNFNNPEKKKINAKEDLRYIPILTRSDAIIYFIGNLGPFFFLIIQTSFSFTFTNE